MTCFKKDTLKGLIQVYKRKVTNSARGVSFREMSISGVSFKPDAR
jgi:hypothetical protein